MLANLTFKDVSIVNGALTGSIVFTINATNTITNQTVGGKTQEVITSNYIKPPAVYQFAIKGDVQGLAEVSKETPDQVFKGKALYITIQGSSDSGQDLRGQMWFVPNSFEATDPAPHYRYDRVFFSLLTSGAPTGQNLQGLASASGDFTIYDKNNPIHRQDQIYWQVMARTINQLVCKQVNPAMQPICYIPKANLDPVVLTLNGQLSQQRAALQKKQSDLSTLQNNADQVVTELGKCTADATQLQMTVDQLAKQLKDLQNNLIAQQNRQTQINQDLVSTQQMIAQQQINNQPLIVKGKELAAKLAVIDPPLQKTQNEIATVNAAITDASLKLKAQQDTIALNQASLETIQKILNEMPQASQLQAKTADNNTAILQTRELIKTAADQLQSLTQFLTENGAADISVIETAKRISTAQEAAQQLQAQIAKTQQETVIQMSYKRMGSNADYFILLLMLAVIVGVVYILFKTRKANAPPQQPPTSKSKHSIK